MNFNEHAHVQTLDMTSLVAGSVGLIHQAVSGPLSSSSAELILQIPRREKGCTLPIGLVLIELVANLGKGKLEDHLQPT